MLRISEPISLNGREKTAKTARTVQLVVLLLTACLSGCAQYHPDPITVADDQTHRPADVMRMVVDTSTLRLPSLHSAPFNPEDGLTSTEVAILAVTNNPDLLLARDDLHIAQAQAFDAGLLPDPQISLYQDAHVPFAGATLAFNAGLSLDLTKIVALGANRAAAKADSRKTDLGLLWQEWQTVAQARLLFVRVSSDRLLLPILQQQLALTRERYTRYAAALAAHEMTSDLVVPALLAYNDAQKATSDMARQSLQNQHDLNDLLGLAPDTTLDLRDDEQFASNAVKVTDIVPRRPDLLALKAGFEAEDARYRAAIINQFPGLSFGWQRARDNSNVYTGGPQLGFTLPLFNRNRGQIAIEKATRSRLHDEYRIRVAQAYADINRIEADIGQLQQRLDTAHIGLPLLQKQAAAAQVAYVQHSITASALADARLALLVRQQTILTAEEMLKEQRIALETFLGTR